MTNIDIPVVVNKLELISRYLISLKRFEQISLNEYLNDFDKQLIVERLLQLMIQAAIDINDHILSRMNIVTSRRSNFEAFIELSKCGVLTPELAGRLAQSAGLRNRLVHEYDDIDSSQVFRAINFALQQYPIYVQQVNAYLNSLDTIL